MNVWAIDVSEFLSFGIDPNIVVAIQLLRNLSVAGDLSYDQQKAVLSADGPFPSIFNCCSDFLSHNATDQQMFGVVRLAVSCCAFFHGFETVSEAAADELTTALVKKLDGMVKQLRTLTDQQKIGGRSAASFKNPVHHVLESHALPASVLHTFYNTRVVRPCRTIAEKYLRSSQKTVPKKLIENEQK